MLFSIIYRGWECFYRKFSALISSLYGSWNDLKDRVIYRECSGADIVSGSLDGSVNRSYIPVRIYLDRIAFFICICYLIAYLIICSFY